MKFYLAPIEHNYAQTVEIEAETEREATEVLDKMYDEGQIIWTQSDFDYERMDKNGDLYSIN